MTPKVDIKQLMVERRPDPRMAPPRHVMTRYVVPLLLLVGFAGLLIWSFRDAWSAGQPVTVVPVVVTRSTLSAAEGTPLFRAAGWVEPRPTASVVTALAEGVIRELLVVEDQEVAAGQTIAVLIDNDARLGLEQAEAEKKLREAEIEVLRTSSEKELANLGFQVQAAKAREDIARIDFDNRTKLFKDGVTSDVNVQKAKSELTAATAHVEELRKRHENFEREYKASLRAAAARLNQAEVAMRAAELRLQRMAVKAPVAGKVLALVAKPGQRLMGLGLGQMEASTVVTLYDPLKLQVRADVRLEDLSRVRPAQAVRIETAALPGGFVEGEVLFSTSQANIQKNTLEVKVALKNPPRVLRPDMLVEATFLAPPSADKSEQSGEHFRLYVPRLLIQGTNQEARVWIVEPGHERAQLRAVKLGQAAGELVEVTSGLDPTQRLIVAGRETLREGDRIRVTGEDTAIGVAGVHKDKGH